MLISKRCGGGVSDKCPEWSKLSAKQKVCYNCDYGTRYYNPPFELRLGVGGGGELKRVLGLAQKG